MILKYKSTRVSKNTAVQLKGEIPGS